jgi:exopolysaccharide biosynthesis WecB/TagA/CpsF family protein
VLVGMGQPRQELWTFENAESTDATFLCIGAYLDFAAGIIPRAPAWIRSLRMEWAFRLANEPRRLAGRYLLGNATFLVYIAKLRIFGNRRGSD